MAELWFVGVGLGDERGIAWGALERLRSARTVFADGYTATLAAGSWDRLAEAIGRPVVPLDRPTLEAGTVVLDALAAGGPVALVVPGDPFTATTHVALRLACERAGHVWRYVPGASILTAAAAFLGLQHYRFGRPVSLPFPAPGFAPTSPIDRIVTNRAQGLHTLVLLDLRPEEPRFLEAGPALRILLERDAEGRAVPPGTDVGVVARIGTDSATAWWGAIETLVDGAFGPPLHAVIVPAPELHFEEQAAVERFRRTGRD